LDANQQEKLRKARPTLNGKRFLRRKLEHLGLSDDIITEPLATVQGGFMFSVNFYFLNLKEAILSYFESSVLRHAGPFHELPSTCPTLRQNGTRMRHSFEQWFAQNPASLLANDFLLFCAFYTDISTKNQTSLYPIYMYFPQFDVLARTQTIESSMILVGWLPVGSFVQVQTEKGKGRFVPISFPRDEVRQPAARWLKKSAWGKLLDHLISLHYDEDFKFPPGSEFEGRRIRPVLYLHVGDLPELFMFLSITQNYEKFCPFCYGFRNECVHKDKFRSPELDRDFAENDFPSMGADPSMCPYNKPLHVSDGNYYKLIAIDLLHAVEGVAERQVEIWTEHHNVNLHYTALSKRYGNYVFNCHVVGFFLSFFI
jgi:hypothetical protein